MAVAFLGERGSFSELAAIEHFGPGLRTIPLPDFSDVFACVSARKASHGIVPIENSLAGSIHQNYDLLMEHSLSIVGEITLRISLCLVANPGVSKKSIRQIFSHPQPFAQCKQYLKQYKKVDLIAQSSTAGAVKHIKENNLRDAAAIASMQAAIDNGMHILDRNIEDHDNNMTRFIILSHKPRVPGTLEKNMKTSVVFSTKNNPGALFRCLAVFALRDIDLYKIESRPMHGKGFNYLFYLDFKGSVCDKETKNALMHLEELTTSCRTLGSYPIGKIVEPKYKKKVK